MKKLLFILLASTVGVAACASSGTSDHNDKRPAMSAKMKQAMDDCAKKAGVKMDKDGRPSKSDMKKLESCMTAKGYKKPEGRPSAH
ncbi:hypothetical protein I6E84_05265 [Psychrobacter sp. SCQQ22]|uniref:hypothetical protein n=1 Tax=Psychrobacter sp. SCQQ22 TaxID=2792059 RepID=UPI0018CDEDBA|nr:hypothetical protein [Psychrobacter sp. SCQQ22]MBH0085626.1 hypothetical protein [Psychrobacter sp. SCQQ22]